MDKISISNLYPSNNITSFQPIDVNSLYNIRGHRIKNKIKLNIQKLANLRNQRKQKVYIQYEKILNICYNKINSANNINKTEIIFEVTTAIYGSFEYNPKDCLLYIQSKLSELKLETIILSNFSIYISWLSLTELNFSP